jgi:hypothetical protein
MSFRVLFYTLDVPCVYFHSLIIFLLYAYVAIMHLCKSLIGQNATTIFVRHLQRTKKAKGFDLQPNHQVFKIRKTPTLLSKSDRVKDMPSQFRENSKN